MLLGECYIKRYEERVRMKYLLAMYTIPGLWESMSQSDQDAVLQKHSELVEELIKAGEMVSGAGLAYAAETTTVLRQNGTRTVKDGPYYPGTAEHPNSFYLLDCQNLERAIAIAQRILDPQDPHTIAVEIRPVVDSIHKDKDA